MTRGTGALCVFLAGYGNLLGALQPPGWVVVALNLSLVAGLLAAARRAGLGWDELGLARHRMASGLRVGMAAAAVVATALGLAAAFPTAASLLRDQRLAGLTPLAFAGHVLVRIPLGTVLLEEVAFRGVLLARLVRGLSPRGAVGVSSAVFGLWHITPTLANVHANAPLAGSLAAFLAVAAGAGFTALAGAVFSFLRMRSGSLVAPVIAHTATNVLGALAAFVALRTG